MGYGRAGRRASYKKAIVTPDRRLQDHRVLRRHGVRRVTREWLLKLISPRLPSRRHMTVSAFEGIDKKAKPERSLTEILKKNSGRNSYGRITVRHRGGGNKRKYRIIDFKRQKDGMAAGPPPGVRSQPLRQHRSAPV